MTARPLTPGHTRAPERAAPRGHFERPQAVPEGARLVTLAELRKMADAESGSLRLGPRGSFLRGWIVSFPLMFSAPLRSCLGGGPSPTHGEPVFSLTLKRLSSWECWAFTAPGAGQRELWIWTLDDEERARQKRRAERAAR